MKSPLCGDNRAARGTGRHALMEEDGTREIVLITGVIFLSVSVAEGSAKLRPG